tara:strand:- start:10453 stop:10734 length:282 start_codon:yes stop_codon:yes gene_type:complete
LDINNMPTYTFQNKKTKEVYDIVMTYDEFVKYNRKRSVERILKPAKVFRLNDGGAESQFREWCHQSAGDIDTSKSNNFRQSKEEYLFSDVKDK